MSGMKILVNRKKNEMEETGDGHDFIENDDVNSEEPKDEENLMEEDSLDEDDFEGHDFYTPSNYAKEPEKKESKGVDDEELMERLKEHLGEDEWEYLDDGERSRLLAVMKASMPKYDVNEQIDNAFKDRANKRQTKKFLSQINEHLKSYSTNFIELANNKNFEKWLQGSRKRMAIFESSMMHHDKESLEDFAQLADEFFQSNSAPKGSPKVGKQRMFDNASKKGAVSEESYKQAIKDLRHPMRRAKAREIIEQYESQKTN